MTDQPILKKPRAEYRPHSVHFGEVAGEYRGDDIMRGAECVIKEDPLFWLRSDRRDDEDVLNYLRQENTFTQSQLFETEKDTVLFEQLQTELKGLIKEDDQSIKIPVGNQNKNFWYKSYYENVEGMSHPVHYLECTDKVSNLSEHYVLLDENKYKDAHNENSRCDIYNLIISHNHKYMLFGLDITGKEIYDVYMFDITDLRNPVKLEHSVPPLQSNFKINKDENLIFYTLVDEARRTNRLYVYDIKSRVSKKLLQNDDILNRVSFSFTTDKEFLEVSISSFSTNTKYYLDISRLDFEKLENSEHCSDLKLIQMGNNEEKYCIDKLGNYFVILTNKFGNPDFIPMYCEIGDDVSESNWKFINQDTLQDMLGKRDGDFIYYKSMDVTKDYVTFLIRHNGTTKIVSTKLFSNDWKIMESSDETCVLSIVHANYDTNELIVSSSSLTIPGIYINYNIDTQQKTIIKEKIVPTYKKDDYESKREYAVSHDGAKVPISLVYKKDYTGTRPLHLYGYGAYGHTVEPIFSKNIIPLLNRGYIFAIAHVRGGSFMGYQWYQQGKMLNKMNTFLDFKAVAEYLVDKKYTTNQLMSCKGESAGGLLVGYFIALFPKLFNAVVAKVPFVDILATMSDPTIPLTAPEWEQWGNPNNKKYFEYMAKYSPYDNIKYDVDYPHYYVTGGLNDPRVQYWEPAKFVAKLRYAQSCGHNKIQTLDIKMNDGHFTSRDRYKYVKETATEYLFLLKTIRM
jgi:oligopeptidase B